VPGFFYSGNKPTLIYSLLVLSSPASGHCAGTAARFAQAAICRGHTVQRVFFLDRGTEAGSDTAIFPQDEQDRLRPWLELAEQHGVDLVLCITSALRHGMLDADEAERHEKSAVTVHPAFSVSGLGQLVDALAKSDRTVTFGG
jgi:tRNA 2-thiouridine synthesizing protein D